MSEALLLCATTRLAQTFRARVPEGATRWRTPQAMTLGQWLASLADEARLSGFAEIPAVLDPFAEGLLWEQVIAGSLDAGSAPLFDLQGMAGTAAEAHQLSQLWEVGPAGFGISEEARLFAAWQEEFLHRCAAIGSLDETGVQKKLLALIEAGWLALPPSVEFVGFDRFTPLEKRLQAALAVRGCEVRVAPAGRFETPAVKVCALPDADGECAAVAAWARSQLAARPAARLAIVAPDLAAVRDALEFALDDALHPALIRADVAETPRRFNFSLGRPLADLPLVRLALDLLALGAVRGKIEQQRLSSLLLAGGWSAGCAEADGRAVLDAAMRRELPYFTTLPALLRLAERLAAHDLLACGQSVTALAAFTQQLGSAPRRQQAGRWAAFFRACLELLGWPGDRSLSSHEYQAVCAFGELLDGFGRFDGLLGSMSMAEAVKRLSQLCRQRVFQPETRGRPAIQVLGVLESAGLDFDALWVMGMNDDRWPPAPRPNPLLPAAVLRAVGAAHASAEVELDFAQRVQARLLVSAPDIHFSHALADGNRLLRPSPLIEGFPAAEAPAVLVSPGRVQATAAGGACEHLSDAWAPPVGPGEKVSGGSWLLRAQAICPAWAFYQYRLGAEAMETPVEGLDPAARGTLVHGALEAFWKTQRDSAALQALDAAGRSAAIERAVMQALADFEEKSRQPLPPAFRQLEAARLARLLELWLEVEAARPQPFEVIACEAPAEVEIEGIRVRMVVDRIDRLADGRQLIVDYKTGAAIDVRNWAAERITEPQLPIYAALVNDAVAAVVFAKVLPDKPAFAGVAEDGDLLPGVQGIGDEKQKIFDPLAFPDWPAVVRHWRGRLQAVAAEVGAGRAGVVVGDEGDLRYCEVLPLLRLPERRRLLAGAATVAPDLSPQRDSGESPS